MGVFGNTHFAIDIDGSAHKGLGITVTTLLDENVRETHREPGRGRMVFSLVFQSCQQRPARVCLGFSEPALPGLRPRLIEEDEIGGSQHLVFRWWVLLSQNTFDGSADPQLRLPEGRFRLAQLPPRLQDDRAMILVVGFPGLA